MNIDRKFFNIISAICFCVLLSFGSKEISAQSSSPLNADLLDGILSSMSGEIEFDKLINSMEGDVVSGALDYIDNAYSDSYNYYGGNSYYGGNYSGNGSGYSYRHLIPGSATLPVIGMVTSRFGYRPSFGRMHRGIDIGLQIGDTVVAAIDGTVERVSFDPRGYGLFVCLRHANGMETRYAHLSRSLVTSGMIVNAGDPIALGGNTGNSTGPHLHFETRVNGTALDPASMFDFSDPGNFSRQRRTLIDLDAMARNQNFGQPYPNYGNSLNSQPQATRNTQKRTYVVKAGDTVASVANKNGISILSLCRLNMLSTNEPLQPGRMLKLR
ncbi:MAG: peptidoglycan DD-metalloendopeptidase family protein [Muribaculaceae bacterium]|nr:peptidoglycan DD-metalloendopeptidase family protein [Muribaculaceae bacterium]